MYEAQPGTDREVYTPQSTTQATFPDCSSHTHLSREVIRIQPFSACVTYRQNLGHFPFEVTREQLLIQSSATMVSNAAPTCAK